MSLLMLLFGLCSGTLLAVLVGLVGSRRTIGFGWSFLLSVLLTPFVGLLITLLSDPLPLGGRSWGCLGTLLALMCVVALVLSALAWMNGFLLFA